MPANNFCCGVSTCPHANVGLHATFLPPTTLTRRFLCNTRPAAMGNKTSTDSGAPPIPPEVVAAASAASGGSFNLKDGYDQLVHAFIRPPRAVYQLSDLGPASFRVGGRWFRRTDLTLKNPQGLSLACSFWEPGSPAGGTMFARPCVVYLHGNSSCRAGVLEMLPSLLVAGFSVFALDFAGCGHSGGKFISLGHFETGDVATAVRYLRECGRVTTIGLWGHSMGSATSMMFAHTDPSVAAMVLDCAFANLQQVVRPRVRLHA